MPKHPHLAHSIHKLLTSQYTVYRRRDAAVSLAVNLLLFLLDRLHGEALDDLVAGVRHTDVVHDEETLRGTPLLRLWGQNAAI